MRCEVVYSAGVWEGRGEGDIWKEERKLLVWSTDENSLKITTKRSINGLRVREEGGTGGRKKYYNRKLPGSFCSNTNSWCGLRWRRERNSSTAEPMF